MARRLDRPHPLFYARSEQMKESILANLSATMLCVCLLESTKSDDMGNQLVGAPFLDVCVLAGRIE